MGSSTIQEIATKGKSWFSGLVDEWGIVIIVILVGLISFGLGRLSALQEGHRPVQVLQAASAAAGAEMAQNGVNSGVLEPQNSGDGAVVASKNGTVYHFPWCSGAQRISASNLVTFASETEAKAAGYRPAKNCKGLSQ